jgi:hypothetical protein
LIGVNISSCVCFVAIFSGLSMFWLVLRYRVCFTQCCQFLWIVHVLIGVKISCMFTQCCQFLWIVHVLYGVKISCMFYPMLPVSLDCPCFNWC